MQDRAVLARIQVPPASLRLMVIQGQLLPAFCARPLLPLFVLQEDVNLSLLQPQLHLLHKPRRSNPQDLFIKFSISHEELLSLRKEAVDLENGFLRIVQGKSAARPSHLEAAA